MSRFLRSDHISTSAQRSRSDYCPPSFSLLRWCFFNFRHVGTFLPKNQKKFCVSGADQKTLSCYPTLPDKKIWTGFGQKDSDTCRSSICKPGRCSLGTQSGPVRRKFPCAPHIGKAARNGGPQMGHQMRGTTSPRSTDCLPQSIHCRENLTHKLASDPCQSMLHKVQVISSLMFTRTRWRTFVTVGESASQNLSPKN